MAKRSFWCTGRGLAALFIVGTAIYFLLMEHREYVFVALPFLIFLLCPFMHLFMHGGHGHGGHEGHHDEMDDDAYRRGFEAGRRQSADEQGREGHFDA